MNKPLIAGIVRVSSIALRELYIEVVCRAVHYLVESLLGYLRYRCIEVEAVFATDCLYFSEYGQCVFCLAYRQYAALCYAQTSVGDYFVHIHHIYRAYAVASGAGAFGCIEREVVRGCLGVCKPCLGAHQQRGEVLRRVAVALHYHHNALAKLHCESYAFGNAFGIFGVDHYFVDYYFDVVVFVPVELHSERYLLHRAVDTHVGVALFSYVFEQLAVVSFAVLDQRGKYEAGFARIFVEYHR